MPKIAHLVMALAFMLGVLVVAGFLVADTVRASHMPPENGDFETGDLTGWTTFTTTNGTLGPGYPRVVLFDTNNMGTATYSAQFSVGQILNENGTRRGGGIYQNVHLVEGEYQITANIAVAFGTPQAGIATDGGLFELLVDGAVVASHNFGYVYVDTTQHNLLASVPVTSTDYHEIRIRITRPGDSSSVLNQYVDNVVISGGPDPIDPAPIDSKPGKNKTNGQTTDGKNCNYQGGKDGNNKGGNLGNCNDGKK